MTRTRGWVSAWRRALCAAGVCFDGSLCVHVRRAVPWCFAFLRFLLLWLAWVAHGGARRRCLLLCACVLFFSLLCRCAVQGTTVLVFFTFLPTQTTKMACGSCASAGCCRRGCGGRQCRTGLYGCRSCCGTTGALTATTVCAIGIAPICAPRPCAAPCATLSAVAAPLALSAPCATACATPCAAPCATACATTGLAYGGSYGARAGWAPRYNAYY